MRRSLLQRLQPLRRLPIHPQWLLSWSRSSLKRWLEQVDAQATVLDVGCADQWPRQILPASCLYLGLDYPSTSIRYLTSADIYANARAIPLASASVSVVLMLDVLEHFKEPVAALAEACRVLRPSGTLLIQVPFLYPLHDLPNDYSRWTANGLSQLLEQQGFEMLKLESDNAPATTGLLLFNLALGGAMLSWVQRKSLACVMLPAMALWILVNNLLGAALGLLLPTNDFMPHSYRILAVKRLQPATPK